MKEDGQVGNTCMNQIKHNRFALIQHEKHPTGIHRSTSAEILDGYT